MNNKEKADLEYFYFKSLKSCFGKEVFKNFIKGESPDFQNEIDSIGVELSLIGNEECAREYSFFQKAIKAGNKRSIEELSDKQYKGDYKDDFEYDEKDKCISWSMVQISDIYSSKDLYYKSLKSKLNKLKKYKKFDKNYLLLIDNYSEYFGIEEGNLRILNDL